MDKGTASRRAGDRFESSTALAERARCWRAEIRFAQTKQRAGRNWHVRHPLRPMMTAPDRSRSRNVTSQVPGG